MTPNSDQTSATVQVFRPTLSDGDYVDALDAEGLLLLDVAESRSFDADIAFCPGWILSELITHLGYIYRWVGVIVGQGRLEPPGRQEITELEDPDPADYTGTLRRLRSAHTALVRLLRQAPPDLASWTIWPAPSARTFWARRMLHETLIHRVDVQNAGVPAIYGGEDLETITATDGIDEMICGFARRYTKTLRSQQSAALALTATDTGQQWWAQISSEAPRFGRGSSPTPADTELRAHSGELLLLLWNRRHADRLTITGRTDVLDIWAREAHL
jgi:uncharacterized protein (TIGR03083 family)